MTSDPAVLTTLIDGVAHIELNRPQAYNAADTAACAALADAVTAAQADEQAKVILLTGRGRAFCAGGDVKAMADAQEPAHMIYELAEASHRAVRAMSALTKPLIAAVHGSAAGAGLGYVCAADIVLAGESTKFLTAFIAIGVSPDSGVSWHLSRIIGHHRALEMMLLNRVLTASEAHDWGLVTSVYPDDAVQDTGLELAKRLAAGPFDALGKTRRLAHESFKRTLDDHLDAERDSITSLIEGDAAQQLIAKFAGR
ncbi:MAG: enoyl-CoA hydratase/isomerase family protein [Nocardioidaceae bacterium]|nr:MAG: enoyl-CoA hydratase/isomerase family protein [Nocardioidaceae bacterium]